MEYLHAQRPAIVHRDLKSHNVLKAFDGSLKVCDFGLVKVRSAQAGTPQYMAPGNMHSPAGNTMTNSIFIFEFQTELFENKPFNKSVDVYAFGVLMWELFTSDIPFYMVDVSDVRRRVVSGDRPKLPSSGLPSSCSRLITQAW